MPALKGYEAPNRELKPSNEGYQSFETVGRRVGGMYREVATSMIATARSSAAMITDKSQWPFTLYALKQKFLPKPTAAQPTGMGFNVRAGRGGSLTDEQFANRVMPNLYATNLSLGAYDTPYNPLQRSLSPDGARINTLDAAARNLSSQLRGLIGSGDPTGGTLGPSPNQDAIESANAWGRTVSGVEASTGVKVSEGDGGYYGGGSDNTGYVEAFPAPASSGVNEAAGLALYPQF